MAEPLDVDPLLLQQCTVEGLNRRAKAAKASKCCQDRKRTGNGIEMEWEWNGNGTREIEISFKDFSLKFTDFTEFLFACRGAPMWCPHHTSSLS
jgi:hypothetical protein